MYAIVGPDPGMREFVAASSGQTLDEAILLITVDRCEVGPFEQTVELKETREERVLTCGSFPQHMSSRVSPHLGLKPSLRAVDEHVTMFSEAGPAERAVELHLYKKHVITSISSVIRDSRASTKVIVARKKDSFYDLESNINSSTVIKYLIYLFINRFS